MRGMRQLVRIAGFASIVLLAGSPAHATFHLMQIEQVIGGVCGDATQQAIQLRMRTGSQNFVEGSSLVVRDATGSNPITLFTFPTDVAVGGTGVRILLASAQFAAQQSPAPDFTLTNLIPQSYLAAGRLTFQGGPTIYWSLAWGGAGYTGTHLGATDNDDNNPGNFGPAFAGALPSTGDQALFFDGLATDESTNNAADYELTAGGAVFTRNNGTAGTALDCTIFTDGFESSDTSAWGRKEP